VFHHLLHACRRDTNRRPSTGGPELCVSSCQLDANTGSQLHKQTICLTSDMTLTCGGEVGGDLQYINRLCYVVVIIIILIPGTHKK